MTEPVISRTGVGASVNAKAPLLGLLLASTILAGCTGLPDDAARLGDTVVMHLEVTDHATGMVLIDTNGPNDSGNPVQLILGDPQAGVSWHLERHLVGASPGDVVEKTLKADTRLSFTNPVTVDLEQGRSAVVVETSLSRFQARYGSPDVGATLQLQPESGFVSYSALVTASVVREGTLTATRLGNGTIQERTQGTQNTTLLDEATMQTESTIGSFTETRYVEPGLIYNENFTGPESRQVRSGSVTYRITLDGPQRDQEPAMYGSIVSTIEGSEVVRRLDPVPGFVYATTPTFNPLGLPQAGAYKVLEVTDTQMKLGHHPKILALIEAQDVDIRAEIVEVQRAEDSGFQEGQPWTARPSPVIAGDPRVPFMPMHEEHGHDEHEEHGHDEHEEHGHDEPQSGHDGHDDHGH